MSMTTPPRTEQLNRLSPEERYSRDPWFHRLVDLLYYHLESAKPGKFGTDFTPTELREAVILACTIFEHRHPRPILVRTGPPCP